MFFLNKFLYESSLYSLSSNRLFRPAEINEISFRFKVNLSPPPNNENWISKY